MTLAGHSHYKILKSSPQDPLTTFFFIKGFAIGNTQNAIRRPFVFLTLNPLKT